MRQRAIDHALRITHYALRVSLSIAVLASQHAFCEELKVTGSGFSLVLPSSEWQVVSATTKKAELVVLGPAKFGADRPTLTVVVGDADSGGERWHTAEGFRDGLLKALELEGATIESKEFPLGVKAKVKATLATMSDAVSDHLTVIALHADRGFCLVCSTPKGTLADIRPEFERVIGSFRFLNVAKGEQLGFEQYGFTIRLPESGWLRDRAAEKQDPGLVLALQRAGDPEKAPTFSIIVGEVALGDRGAGALDALALDAMRELGNARGVTIGELVKGALASHPSLSIKVTGEDAEGEVTIVVRENQYYHIAWSAPVGELDKYELEMRSILNSIKFVAPKQAPPAE